MVVELCTIGRHQTWRTTDVESIISDHSSPISGVVEPNSIHQRCASYWIVIIHL